MKTAACESVGRGFESRPPPVRSYFSRLIFPGQGRMNRDRLQEKLTYWPAPTITGGDYGRKVV